MSLLKIRQFSIDQTDTFTFANANISANGSIILNGALSNVTGANLVSANYFSGGGSLLTNLTGANVSGQVANALVAGTVYGAAQTNITSLGALTGLTSTGTVNFTGASNVALGNVSNLYLSGGSSGQVLRSDGSGAVSWYTPSSGTGNANIAGSNTQVFFNDNGSSTLGAKSTFTFDKGTDTLAVTKINANGALLTNITGANVDGNVTYAITSNWSNVANSVSGTNVSGNVSSAVQAHYANIANSVAFANITDKPTFYSNTDAAAYLATATFTTTGNITANVITATTFSGNGSAITYIAGANVSGNVDYAKTSNWANTANSVSWANVTSTPTSLSGYGITDAYSNTNTAAYLATATFTTTGNITANVVSATTFSGNGSAITYIAGANVSGNVDYAKTSNWANIANSVAGANVSGNVASAVQSNYANTANSVSWTNVTSTPTSISGYGITDAYSNTNAGAYLTTYSGNLAGTNLTLTGNLVIGGTTTRVNSTVTTVVDPIFEIGGGANGASLSSDDNKDRGLLLHYYSGSAAVDAFMGWDDSNVEFGIGSNVSVSGEVVTWNSYGNLRAGYFMGDGSQLTGVQATSAYRTANGTSNVNIAVSNGNITMGVNGTANVVVVTDTGIVATNVNGGNLVSANYFSGNGFLLTSTAGANVSGNVSFAVTSNWANVANSVSWTNITSLPTFYSNSNAGAYLESYTGNISANVVSATTFSGNGSAITYITGGNVSGNVASAVQSNYANTANAVGTLTGLTSTGTINFTGASNVSLGAVANLHISGGSADYFLKTNGSGVLSFASVPSTTLTVDTFTGDGSWTMKTLTVTPASSAYTIVAIGGVSQPRTSYSLSGAVITFSDPPPNGAIVEITTVIGGAAGAGGGGTSWTYSAVSANTSAVAGYRYIVDTSTANLTITLPASATLGDEIMIIDGTGTASTHEITVGRNGGNIQGGASNMTVSTDRAAFTLVYYNATQGWILTNV